MELYDCISLKNIYIYKSNYQDVRREMTQNTDVEEMTDFGVMGMAFAYDRHVKWCKLAKVPNYHKTIETYYKSILSSTNLERVSDYYRVNIKKN